MTLIKIKHYYDNGAGNNVGDVWSEVNADEDWTEDQCRDYVEEQDNETYVLDHNEYARPNWYMVDKTLPDWSDGGWYDYDKCESRDKADSICDTGCDNCPHIGSCHKLQREQEIDWITANGMEARG